MTIYPNDHSEGIDPETIDPSAPIHFVAIRSNELVAILMDHVKQERILPLLQALKGSMEYQHTESFRMLIDNLIQIWSE